MRINEELKNVPLGALYFKYIHEEWGPTNISEETILYFMKRGKWQKKNIGPAAYELEITRPLFIIFKNLKYVGKEIAPVYQGEIISLHNIVSAATFVEYLQPVYKVVARFNIENTNEALYSTGYGNLGKYYYTDVGKSIIIPTLDVPLFNEQEVKLTLFEDFPAATGILKLMRGKITYSYIYNNAQHEIAWVTATKLFEKGIAIKIFDLLNKYEEENEKPEEVDQKIINLLQEILSEGDL